jgi:hypothetical protein
MKIKDELGVLTAKAVQDLQEVQDILYKLNLDFFDVECVHVFAQRSGVSVVIDTNVKNAKKIVTKFREQGWKEGTRFSDGHGTNTFMKEQFSYPMISVSYPMFLKTL